MSDTVCYEIVDTDSSGITVKCGERDIKIRFEECAERFAAEKSLENSRCVATRDITKLTFTFYADPLIKVVFKKHFLKDLLPGKSAVHRFRQLQKTINRYGYTSYDLS